MEREIRARTGTARLLLDRVAGDPTALAAASRTQAIAFVDDVRRADKTDRAVVGELAQNVQWAASDAMTIGIRIPRSRRPALNAAPGFTTHPRLLV